MALRRKKKELSPQKLELFRNYKKNPSAADRNDFPGDVAERLIVEANGVCQCCDQRRDAHSHHVMPRARNGRGVYENGLRVCTDCHDWLHADEENLQVWISKHMDMYGTNFWLDEKDWDEFHRREAAAAKIVIQEQRRESIKHSFISIVTMWQGRELKKKEVKLIEKLLAGEREMDLIKNLFDIKAPIEEHHDENQTRIEEFLAN
ncbi:HNH endonuclease [Paenibacillus sp. WQ 127069]|uniref:HNH endonuclease n=1 Tax=Paenibacillus baimaensis TaxID=2982185 RepID=A0ABT2UTT8_9BACL|nr:HNH endonuclease [Paenibacillus sp. WQ 127069]MCU6798023.1 HNH endonuclease [Paenibacillus sp. WQ 127069]